MIEAEGLHKSFGGREVVKGVSLSVGGGQIFGLLGPNAAGKTTTIRMLCGILPHDAGAVQIAGASVEKARSHFGYVAQHFGQYEELSVWENLQFYARMYGVHDRQRLHDLLERYGLERFRRHLAGTLSGGYQRRLALACALAHDPEVLFLDEPTAGIDPLTRKLLWDDFYQLAAEGKALLVTTHYMEEAQRCHQLAFLAAGEVVAAGTPGTIRDALHGAQVYRAEISYDPAVHAALRRLPGIELVNQFGDELRVVANAGVLLEALEAETQQLHAQPVAWERVPANLEDVFIALTSRAEPSS